MTAIDKANQIQSHRQRLSRQATELARKDARIKELASEGDDLAKIVHRYRYLLGRCNTELLSVLADINADQVPHDGDDFHELLRDLGEALSIPK